MNFKTMVIAGVGLVVIVLLLSGLAGLMTRIFGSGTPDVQGNVVTPPAPNLQIAPQQDLQSYLATQRAPLESYGWVNRQTGAVRIPIDRAMELIAERGLPVEPRQSGADEGTGEDNSGFTATATPAAGGGGTP